MIVDTDVGRLQMPDGCFGKINYENGVYNEVLLTKKLGDSLDAIKQGSGNYLFVDIGANIGYYSLFASVKNVKVLAVEASLKNYFLLCNNISSNIAKDITTLRSMAWNADETGLLYINSDNCGDHRPFGDGQTELTTKTRLDTVLKQYEVANGQIDRMVVKIDTQGSDHIVLDGFGDYRDRVVDCFVECWPFGMQNVDGSTVDTVAEKYRSWGFEVLPIEQELDTITGDAYLNLHLTRR